MKLLYAEDEPAMAEAVVDFLSFHHFTIDAVDNGDDALESARTGDYDGLILDVMMPGKSGLEVLTTLRREGVRTPVLLLVMYLSRRAIQPIAEGLGGSVSARFEEEDVIVFSVGL